MKVFGIGMQRTGLTSLTMALNQLGIKSIQFPKELYYDIEHEIIGQYDGFTDTPIQMLYKELEERHPDSKFILTLRDENTWLKSVEWLFTIGAIKFAEAKKLYADEFHQRLYGTSQFDKDAFLKKFRSHNREVRAHFANRPHRLLIMNIGQGDGFLKLCRFLEKPVPDNNEFPHRNKSQGIVKVRIWKLMKRLGI